ncbi:3-isopropylmalate dehydratase [Phototrophicus methaneseepsis]|uniref:3-isopropylmalate dehydratase n=1 Tax=Phototrophicus methaneseepsis TaxID=2710758 RepID=A0A7S8E7A7_9CHLR|nr:3-isopropylmalate dehydratase [Phototrophicus methaneseepsis]QPC81650.1 3-isopropylmalate dehydratase [Phototrophicus methaneseepsis]
MSTHRVWVYGDHVNTDVIFPGKFTYTLKDPQAMADVALQDLDPTFASEVQEGDVIVAGRNWGCGSSREQAVTALKYNGIRIIIAESFGGLYFRNCINQGVHPIVCPGLVAHLQTGDTIEIDLEENAIIAGNTVYRIPSLSSTVQAILQAGGLVPMLQRRTGRLA